MTSRPAPPAVPYPNAGQATLLAVAALGLQLAGGATAFAIITFWFSDSPAAAGARLVSPWVLLPIFIFCICMVLALGLRVTREPVKEFFQVHPFAAGVVPAVIVTSLGMAILLHEIDNSIMHLVSLISGPKKLPPDLMDIASAPVGSFLIAIVAAPLLEEYLFRGMILRGLLVHSRRVRAVLFSALLFGIVHANLRQFVIGLTLGLAFGWWYERTRSVGPGMIGHAIVNSVTWVSAMLPGAAARLGLFRPSGTVVHEPGWLFVSGLMLTALGVWSFHRKAFDLQPEHSWPQLYHCVDEPPQLDQVPLADPPPLLDQPPLLEPRID